MKKYNYNTLIKENLTVYVELTNSLGQIIKLVEHPIFGDESPIIAICDELQLAEGTGFFDCEDMLENHLEYEPKFINSHLYIGDNKCN